MMLFTTNASYNTTLHHLIAEAMKVNGGLLGPRPNYYSQLTARQTLPGLIEAETTSKRSKRPVTIK